MPTVTIQIIDGAERGRVYENAPLPVTVGREEGNTIQLNDERVSRFHLKIQEDHEQVVLTDLDSTNGTKVNGEDIRLRILRHGDLIAVGRSVMVFGSRDQIAARLRLLRGSLGDERTVGPDDEDEEPLGSSLDFELSWSEHAQATLHALVPPDLPARLSPGQAAQLSELIEYLHIRIRLLIETVRVDEDAETVALDQRQWQGLIELQSRLATYLRTIGDPSA
jgi:pSer/pThr/pTyr-binding forkhead associated (FHA) protein